MQPLIEDKPYSVKIDDRRFRARSVPEATEIAERELVEWKLIGFFKTAEIFYRDGRLVRSISSNEVHVKEIL